MRIILNLKLFWLILISLTVVIPVFLYWKYPAFALWEAAIFILGSLEAIFTSALFTCKDVLLVRGIEDAVYVIENRLLNPQILRVANDETMGAFGLKWQDVYNIAQRPLTLLRYFLSDLCHKDTMLNIKQAKLIYPLPNQNTWYCILRNKRHGIPDPRTLKKIWTNDEIRKAEKWDLRQLGKTKIGRDLLSEQYWKE